MRRRAVLAIVALTVLVSAAPAAAHDPIILTSDQADAASGPLLPDGSISFALYGVVDAPGATRGFTARFAGGERLYLTLLIPDRAPENVLTTAELPLLRVTSPDGTVRELVANEAVVFEEAFSATTYVRLLTVDETAQAGEYQVIVTGSVPARFTVAIGDVEQFGTPVERVPNRDDPAAGVNGVQAWYDTPPPAVESTGEAAAGTTSTSAATPTRAPTTDAPATDAPATDAPATDASATDAPATDASATDAPAASTSATGTGGGTNEWLAPLLIATGAGAAAIAIGLYYGFVRPGRTRRRGSSGPAT